MLFIKFEANGICPGKKTKLAMFVYYGNLFLKNAVSILKRYELDYLRINKI
jgi:hypothetical protein